MIDWDKIRTTSNKGWLLSLINDGLPEIRVKVPAMERSAAMRLYELGEREVGFETILRQMRQYKDPNVHRNTKYETCTAAMIALGQLGDGRAVEDLFEALGEFTDIPAFALSLINGKDLEERLLELSKVEGGQGFGAKLALGFMGSKKGLPDIIEILNAENEYRERFKGKIMGFLRDDLMYMFGNYLIEEAQRVFLNKLNKSDIERFARDYEIIERRRTRYGDKYTDLSTLGWRIVKKYGWDRYLDTEEKRFPFSGYVVSQWTKVYDGSCPFKQQSEADQIRDIIIESIWKEIHVNDKVPPV